MSLTKYIDPKISVGHILTALMLVGTLIGMWKTTEIRLAELAKEQAFQDHRIESVEVNQAKLAENQNQTALALERVAAKLEIIEKRPTARFEP